MIIINYHEISAGRESHRYVVSRKLLQEQIDSLIEREFSFVTPADLLDEPPEERPHQCAITFDDGRLGAYEHGAPILRERGIKATYFVCPDWLEKKPAAPAESYSDFMTWDHVAALAADGNVIGSHGKSHLPFFDIDAASAAHQVSESKRLIEQRLQTPCAHFAAPWGQINRTVMGQVRGCGYKTMCSTVVGSNKVPYDLFRLRRLDASHYPSRRHFTRALSGHIKAHSKFDVALLTVRESWSRSVPETEIVARYDLVVCLDERSYELGTELGLPRLRLQPGDGRDFEAVRALVLKAYGDRVRERQMTATAVTLGERHPAWTFLSSFLPGTSRIRSSIRSRISTRP